MIDTAECGGCKSCAIACMQAHRCDTGDVYSLDLSDPRNESRNYILLGGGGEYIPLFCRHCDSPECVMSCMSGAMAKDEKTGYVLYDVDKCGACFMCVMSCPFGVLKPDLATGSKVIKCDFCSHDPDGPNCIRNCPKHAIYVKEVAL